MRKFNFAVSAAIVLALNSNPAEAADDKDIELLRKEISNMKAAYEGRIQELETKLAKIDEKKVQAPAPAPAPADTGGRKILDNSFNPSIGVILNGQLSSYSNDSGDFAGFAVGEEGERSSRGFSVGESELNFSSNIDDKFFGSLTAALVNEDGTEVELEEAFIQTTPGLGLPDGLSLKAGRALWTLGYLNEHHAHTDDFADRPLPYRAFLNNHFNDDGLELTYVLPTEMYTEVGVGAFRGDDYPFGEADGKTFGAWSAFVRVGDDIGDNQSWRVGAYVLSGEADNRETNEGDVTFRGDNTLYALDARYIWAPTGNNKEQEVILQGEYFLKSEDGVYEDIPAGTGLVGFDDNQSGWYGQAVYKFAPQWRVGARYSQLYASDTPAGLVGSVLDADGHDPYSISFMGDWTNSEFSRIRAQYNREELANGLGDNQFMLQYIMSIGAHGAHAY